MRIFWKAGDRLNARGRSKTTGEFIQVICTALQDGSNEDPELMLVELMDGTKVRIPCRYVWMVRDQRSEKEDPWR